mmetsp:Transcript_3286/g.4915  ORF Transcript_3286/g.4915 Transcript_3286/m.4915 type:complete len:480 (+) Transcript_3286:303-1742(+)
MAALFFLLIPCLYLLYLCGGGIRNCADNLVSRSFFLERMRINCEICCEGVGDLLSGSASALKKPLLFLAAVAIVMTLRSARRSVQTMKAGGLTAGVHDPSYKAMTGSSSTSAYSSMFGSSSSSSASSSSFRSPAAASSLAASSLAVTGLAGSIKSDQPSRPLADLEDQHNAQIRIIADGQTFFHDYGGIRDFYGPVQTLKANNGFLVVEKVLEEAGNHRILVIDNGNDKRQAVFGKAAAQMAKNKGWRGVVVFGMIRDAAAIAQIGIGVKALGVHPKKGTGSSGNKDVQVMIGGQSVISNHWVYCDQDGVGFSNAELTIGAQQRTTTTTPGQTTTTPGQTTTTPGQTTTSPYQTTTTPGQTTTSSASTPYQATTTPGQTTSSASTPYQSTATTTPNTNQYGQASASSTYSGQTSTYPGQQQQQQNSPYGQQTSPYGQQQNQYGQVQQQYGQYNPAFSASSTFSYWCSMAILLFVSIVVC